MKNKGFTLIELLAVIVILAIIALIAVPIILDLIDDTKKKTIIVSAENYLSAVEQAIAKESMEKPNENLDGKYKIIENGKKVQSVTNANKIYTIEYNGNGLTEGTLQIIDGKVRHTNYIKMDKWYVKNNSGGLSLVDKYETNTLVDGSTFNSRIKSLGEVIAIEFLYSGEIPQGYTTEDFKEKGIDLSAKNDKSILALYKEGNVYVYSENVILFNQKSGSMFSSFPLLETIVFGDIDTSKVTSMGAMFAYSPNLKNLELSGFDISRVTSVYQMFAESGFEQLDLSSFNTSNITDMTWMFRGCKNLKEIIFGDNFNTQNVTTMSEMFRGCSSLEKLDVSKFDTSKVTRMEGMFMVCSSLEELDVSNFDTSQLTRIDSMFYDCKNLTSLDVNHFDTSKVTSFYGVFSNCSSLEELDVSNWDTSNVTNMGTNSSYGAMFQGCSSLKTLDLNNWDVSKVTNMRNMFARCNNLINLNINNWNTIQVTNMGGMFQGCSRLKTLDLSNWNTSNVTNMEWLFYGSSSFSELTIGCNWKTSESNSDMFAGTKYNMEKLNKQIEDIQEKCTIE